MNYDFNRRWTPLLGFNSVKRVASKLPTLKLVSYNILAQDLLLEHLYLYKGIQQEFLTWSHRQRNLHRELVRLDPDILCLQEIQIDHLARFIQGLRVGSGRRLAFVYKKKTGHRTDGCAIVYDKEKFQLIDRRAVELHDPNVALLDREMVALLAKFRIKNHSSIKKFVVATTHLLYSPHRSDVRCAQVARVLRELNTFAADGAPVIIAGDFNSEKHTSPIKLLIGSEEGQKLRFNVLDPGQGRASTFQDNWITVDHILTGSRDRIGQKNKLLPISIYSLPTVQACCRVGRIPNRYMGSDHYATGVIFSII